MRGTRGIRPCTCERNGCRLCWLANNDPRYRRLWGVDGSPIEPDGEIDCCGRNKVNYEEVTKMPESKLRWAYGVTTVEERADTYLPRTLASMAQGGFDRPSLFVDGIDSRDVHRKYTSRYPFCEVTSRSQPARTHGNWVLALTELYVKNPTHERFAVFQDDLICSKNLRQYLERCRPLDERGYYNLYTVPMNEELSPSQEYVGWFLSNQLGKGALATVLTNEGARELLKHPHMVDRPMDTNGHRSVDGGIVAAMTKAGWKEYCHLPSLVQHIGDFTSMGSSVRAKPRSFKGEEFDLLTLVEG